LDPLTLKTEHPIPKPRVALLPWGNVIEDFLGSISLTIEDFASEMSGGWMFGYVDALKRGGIETVIFCISARVDRPTRLLHRSTGATICILPVPGIYRRLLALVPRKLRRFGRERLRLAILTQLGPYLATPILVLARELRREKCGAILCQEYEYPRFDMCVLLGKALRIPVYATFQGGVQTSLLEPFVRPLTIRGCAGLIIASKTERLRVYSRYRTSPEKIAHTFNPIDLAMWFPEERSHARSQLGIAQDARVAIWHGRVEIHRKGIDHQIKARDRICRDRPGQNLLLILIGTGTDASKLLELINTLDSSKVIWRNEYLLDRGIMRLYLSSGDVYAFPSRHEGFPVAPVEAMACGLAVVATRASGIDDLLEGGESSGGVIVPLEDADEFARQLGRILDDRALSQRLGALARKRTETAFSLDAVAEKLVEFVQSQTVTTCEKSC
jgi:glycosyltransferase involved in cell wall biosynthesis